MAPRLNTIVAAAALLLATTTTQTLAAPSADAVPSLPGAPPLTSSHYSGYLAATGGKRTHYHFVQSETAPATAPVIVWLNGGPPCSSLIGDFLENGPIVMSINGTLVENVGSWTKTANMLFLESPVGVGFSYWPGNSLPYRADDNTTAADNVATLLSFYAAFPEHATSDLFITGESYAGVWADAAALRIGAGSRRDLNCAPYFAFIPPRRLRADVRCGHPGDRPGTHPVPAEGNYGRKRGGRNRRLVRGRVDTPAHAACL